MAMNRRNRLEAIEQRRRSKARCALITTADVDYYEAVADAAYEAADRGAKSYVCVPGKLSRAEWIARYSPGNTLGETDGR